MSKAGNECLRMLLAPVPPADGELSHEAFIAQVAELYPAYQPNEAVLDDIGQREIHLTTITGPSGAGKDHNRRRAARVAAIEFGVTLHQVVGDTDREPREGQEVDGVDYYFRAHERAQIIEELQRGAYVQIGMGDGHSFYGTRPMAFPLQGHAILDIVADQIAGMRKLPFASFGAAYVVTPFDRWMERFMARGFTPAQTEKRLLEAKNSLSTSLEDDEIVHILNEEGDFAAEALAVLAIYRRFDKTKAAKARAVAEAVLAQLSKEV